jgi:hypothetical protein
MKKKLIQFLHWLLVKLEGDLEYFFIPPEVKILMPTAIALCAHHEGSQSGEWRRHQVLARLMKAGASERDAALAIELAVRKS